MSVTTAWLALVALTIGPGMAVQAAAQPAGTLVVGLVAEPVNLDPAQVTDLNSNRVGRRLVETLVTFPDESTQIVPGLAESDRKSTRLNSSHANISYAVFCLK